MSTENNEYGKYAVIDARKIDKNNQEVMNALKVLEENNLINYGKEKSENEFFVLMLKDIHSTAALQGYANDVLDRIKDLINNTNQVYPNDVNYFAFITQLASRSGVNNPSCKFPD